MPIFCLSICLAGSYFEEGKRGRMKRVFFKEGSNFLHHHLADGAGNVFFYSVHDLVSKYYNSMTELCCYLFGYNG